MKKLNLNIQRFSSTNATTHYELSQYIGTDKPTYLVDYNGDMSKIDSGIYNAQTKANNNESSIGDLTTLTTDTKSSLVGAINEIDAHTDTNTTNISNNTTDIATNTSAIGTLANLETTTKSNLVNAINEVEGNIEKFNLTHFDTYTISEIYSSGNVSSINGNITVATNDDGSVFKVYTSQLITINNDFNEAYIYINTRIRPTNNITINGAGIKMYQGSGGEYVWFGGVDLNIDTTGKVTIYVTKGFTQEARQFMVISPCLYFAKDFGDTPTPTPNA